MFEFLREFVDQAFLYLRVNRLLERLLGDEHCQSDCLSAQIYRHPAAFLCNPAAGILDQPLGLSFGIAQYLVTPPLAILDAELERGAGLLFGVGHSFVPLRFERFGLGVQGSGTADVVADILGSVFHEQGEGLPEEPPE
jgi:hypothetical protein